jgi:hypothetical protein
MKSGLYTANVNKKMQTAEGDNRLNALQNIYQSCPAKPPIYSMTYLQPSNKIGPVVPKDKIKIMVKP